MALDFDRLQHLAALFHIHEKAMGHPKLKPIADEAMKHLEEHAESLLPSQPEPEPIVDEGQDMEQVHTDQPEDEVDLRHDREPETVATRR